MVPTAERKVSLSIPPGTQCGQQFRLRGRGVPIAGGGKRTDLYVEVKVVVPAATEEPAKHLFREIAKLYPENPRVHG